MTVRNMPPVALVALCALGVAACGGSATHAGTTTQAVTPAPTTTAAQPATAPSRATGKKTRAVKTREPKTTKPKSPATRAPVAKTTPASPLSAGTAAQSKMVLACLTRAKLAPVSAASSGAWSGYAAKTGTFVYVERYRTTTAVLAHVHSLRRESVAAAGLYVAYESITPYPGAPVPKVAACLGGKSTPNGGSNSNSGKKKKRGFIF